MSQTVKGVIARGKGLPVELVDINVPKPGPGEARVRVQACGVCHTDLHYREGGINDDFPFLLGHEAAGVVESIGENVTNVKPGDFVVLNWRAVCWLNWPSMMPPQWFSEHKMKYWPPWPVMVQFAPTENSAWMK
jgi:threonine dehydrogenase-like Zn-dependent dehydrogenase